MRKIYNIIKLFVLLSAAFSASTAYSQTVYMYTYSNTYNTKISSAHKDLPVYSIYGYSYPLNSTTPNTLSSLNFNVRGTFTADEIYVYKLWMSKQYHLDESAVLIATAAGFDLGTVTSANLSFTGINAILHSYGEPDYRNFGLFLTVDVITTGTGKNFVIGGARDFKINEGWSNTSYPYNFATSQSQVVSVTGTPVMELSQNGSASGNVSQKSKNNRLVNLLLDNTTNPAATLSALQFTFNGTFTGGDITKASLWGYNIYTNKYEVISEIDGSLIMPDSLLSFELENGFTVFNNNYGYFYVTFDVSETAPIGMQVGFYNVKGEDFSFLDGSAEGTVTGVSKTVVTPSVSLTTYNPGNAKVDPGRKNYTLYYLNMNVSNAPAKLDDVILKIGGNFDGNDITRIRLIHSPYNFSIDYYGTVLGIIRPTLGGGNFSFTGLDFQLERGSNNYLFVIVDLADDASVGKTFSMESLSVPGNLRFSVGTTTGTPLASGVQTITRPNVSFAGINIAASPLGLGTQRNAIYSFKAVSRDADAILRSLAFQMKGSFESASVYNPTLYYNYSGSTDPDNFSYLSQLYSTISSGTKYTFTGMNFTMQENDEIYFFITFEVSPSAPLGSTVGINTMSLNDVGFTSATKRGSFNNGNLFTIRQGRAAVTTKEIPEGFLRPGTNENRIHAIEINVTNAPVYLERYLFTTAGTYMANDLKYYYNHRVVLTNSLTGSNYSYRDYTYTTGSSGDAFNVSINKTLPIGKTYLLLLSDINSSAVVNRTVGIAKGSPKDLRFSVVTATGTLEASNLQTISNAKVTYRVTDKGKGGTVGSDEYFKLMTLELNVERTSGYINTVRFLTAGTFTGSDVDFYRLYLTESPVFDIETSDYVTYSQLNATGSGQQLNFNFYTELGIKKWYLHLMAYSETNFSNGAQINISTVVGVEFGDNSAVSGTSQVGNVFTLNRNLIYVPSPAISSRIGGGTSANLLYKFQLKSNASPANFVKAVFSVSGNNLNALTNFRMRVNEYGDDLNNAYTFFNSGVFVTTGGQNLVTFTGSNYSVYYYNQLNYFYLVADFNGAAVEGDVFSAQLISIESNNSSIVGPAFERGGVHTVGGVVVRATNASIPAGGIAPDGNNYVPIYAFALESSSNFLLSQLLLTTSGTYTNTDIFNLRVYSSSKPVFDDDANQITSINLTKTLPSVSGENLVINLSNSVNANKKTYFFIAARGSVAAALGSTIKVEAGAIPVISFGTFTGVLNAGNVHTVVSPVVNITVEPVAGTKVGRGTTNTIYTLKVVTTGAPVSITNLVANFVGSYTGTDIDNFYMYYSKDASIYGDAVRVSSLNAAGTGENVTFSENSALLFLPVGTSYIHIAANVGTSASTTAGVQLNSISGITLSSGSLNVSVIGTAGSLFTIGNSRIDVKGNRYSGGKINIGTVNNPIYRYTVSVSGASTYFSYFYQDILGTYTASEISQNEGAKVWLSNSPDFNAATAKRIDSRGIETAGNYSYFYPYNTMSEGIAYVFVTVDASNSAVVGRTIKFNNNFGYSAPYALSSSSSAVEGSQFVFGVPSSATDLLSFTLPNQIGETTITGNVVTLMLPTGTDVSALAATFGISAYASASVNNVTQVSGQTTNNYASPLNFAVRAETGATKVYTINVIFGSPNSVQESLNSLSAELFPQPASTVLTIKSNGYSKAFFYDTIGNKVLESDLSGLDLINISGLSDGLYFVKLANKEKSITKKLIVAK